MNDFIEIKKARIHNLKNVDVTIPRNKLTVITGVSGSGKSSLAFDTLYEEGKRRYLMFSGTQFMVDSVPTFDKITGLSPTVAVEQRIIRQSNPRSTVGSRTKISNMLAALFATSGDVAPEYVEESMPLTMELFLKNSPKGMCVKCLGSGIVKYIDEEALYGDSAMAVEDILEGKFKLIRTWKNRINDYYRNLKVSPTQTLGTLSIEQLNALKYGSPKTNFAGVNAFIPTYLLKDSEELSERQRLFAFQKQYGWNESCSRCNGTGLNEIAAHTYINGKTIHQLEKLYIKELYEFLQEVGNQKESPILTEIVSKLQCMVDVGLHHLSLSRQVPTLSGGEIQRLFLASYIIAEMDSIIFVFDEPTIGLHEVEKHKLIQIIKNLVERGNTVIAVEHDKNFMKNADYIIDLGPDAGYLGGGKVFEGTYEEFLTCKNSRTSPYLNNDFHDLFKKVYKPVDKTKLLTIEHGNLHNLKDVTVEIPLGLLVGVAGVSGSGKSSLISDTLVPSLKELLKSKCIYNYSSESEDGTDDRKDNNIKDNNIKDNDIKDNSMNDNNMEFLSEQSVNATITGYEDISRCIIIDQKPIGRSRTSCPATYTGMFDRIRDLFAKTEYAIENGFTKGLFTVNSKGGCRYCRGDGVIHYHVGFGNHMEVTCEQCEGTGYIPEAMEVTLDGKNIREVLDLTVEEAIPFFKGKDRGIDQILSTLQNVGMGYIKLGQKTPSISGGESQRVKLATELAKISKTKLPKNMVYILDEPTTGLSYHDSIRLLKLMQELVESGSSVIVTEHDPFILANCDYIIEMGVGGGSDGGNVIATGTPEELRKNQKSIIGRYL